MVYKYIGIRIIHHDMSSGLNIDLFAHTQASTCAANLHCESFQSVMCDSCFAMSPSPPRSYPLILHRPHTNSKNIHTYRFIVLSLKRLCHLIILPYGCSSQAYGNSTASQSGSMVDAGCARWRNSDPSHVNQTYLIRGRTSMFSVVFR